MSHVKMKNAPLLIFLSLVTPCLAELMPALENVANKQKQVAKTIFDERVDELIKIQDPYIAELKAAALKVTENGNADLQTAITAEQGRLERGTIPENSPEGLPKGLLVARKTYLRNYERLDSTFDKRRKELDSAYLAQLGKFQKEKAGDAMWATQIESEKKRVLSGAWGPITDMKIGLPGTKWINNNDGKSVRTFTADGKVAETDGVGRWNYEIPDEKTVIIHWNGDNHMPMHLQKNGKTMTDYNGSWTLLPKGPE